MEEEEDGLERFISSITNIRIIRIISYTVARIISYTVEARRTG